MNLMTTSHPAWERFFRLLVHECDFQQSDPDDASTITFKCDGTQNKARKILQQMGGFSVNESLDYMSDHGGHCDCEILFNVAADRDWTDHDTIKES